MTKFCLLQTLLRGDRPLAHSVLSVLNSMAPTEQYTKTGAVSQSGYYIGMDSDHAGKLSRRLYPDGFLIHIHEELIHNVQGHKVDLLWIITSCYP